MDHLMLRNQLHNNPNHSHHLPPPSLPHRLPPPPPVASRQPSPAAQPHLPYSTSPLAIIKKPQLLLSTSYSSQTQLQQQQHHHHHQTGAYLPTTLNSGNASNAAANLTVSAWLDSIAAAATIANINKCPSLGDCSTLNTTTTTTPELADLQVVGCASGNSSDNGNSSTYLLDRKARKKDQNRRAAFNYRRKKMEERNRIREEEMRLVYSRVCQIGYAEHLEKVIMYILETKATRIQDSDGSIKCYLCPLCPVSCDSTLNLRSHLNLVHYST